MSKSMDYDQALRDALDANGALQEAEEVPDKVKGEKTPAASERQDAGNQQEQDS